jgi:hypothetical protein
MIKTTVKAHTGSAKRGTYKVVTGTLVDYVRRDLEGGRHYVVEALIVDADGAEYLVSNGRIIETTHTVVEPEAEPEPKGIRFEESKCGRCGGVGVKSDGGWGANNHGRCFRCGGRGVALTGNGYRAQQAYVKMRDEALTVKISELADGEAFWYDAGFGTKCYAKGDGSIRFGYDATVRRHDGPACRAMWKVIARQYKGATLVY